MSAESRAVALVDQLDVEYQRSVKSLRGALHAFLATGAAPDPALRADWVYPALILTYAAKGPATRLPRAFARFSQSGTYSATITRPDLFRDYLIEQLSLLLGDFEVDAANRLQEAVPRIQSLDGQERHCVPRVPI